MKRTLTGKFADVPVNESAESIAERSKWQTQIRFSKEFSGQRAAGRCGMGDAPRSKRDGCKT